MLEILDLVDALTLPQPEKVAQKVNNEWVTRWVSHDPLLKQLGDAVWPSGERNGGGGGLKSTRSPADLDALYEYAKMSTAIGDWCHLVGVRATHHPVEDLRAWYAASLSRQIDEDYHHRMLSQWVGKARAQLRASKVVPLGIACPVCGRREWSVLVDGEHLGGTFPLRVEYWMDDDERVRDVRALCHACSTAWIGAEAVTELADEVNDVKTG
jgi:hypothetical protein